MSVLVEDRDLTILVGDALETLRTLPAGSVNCVVTSPPYFGLRDYSTAGQLGLEPTLSEYVTTLVAVFREVRRVVRHDATLFLNLGDSHHQKQLQGVPWRVAFALQADGWYLRSDIVWSKPNPMPESVTDRPTKSHEYVFMLSKGPRYWFDQEAVREPHRWQDEELLRTNAQARQGARIAARREAGDDSVVRTQPPVGREKGRGKNGNHESEFSASPAGRNVRSVWEIATQPYAGAHFATYPEELVRRCVLAGCPEWVCGTCGKPRERIVERGELVGKDRGGNYNGRDIDPGVNRNHGTPGMAYENTTVGWSDCGHGNYKPGVVLDPFGGSGTTGLVARRHGRRSILIELNAGYARLAAERCQQLSLLAEVGA